jgi:hypothetical protein
MSAEGRAGLRFAVRARDKNRGKSRGKNKGKESRLLAFFKV